MGLFRRLPDILRRRIASIVATSAPHQRRVMIAALCAICLLALTGTVLLFAAQRDPQGISNLARTSPTNALQNATETPADPPTVTPQPTTTPTKSGGKTVSTKPVNVPHPPPPPPPPPATPTPTPCVAPTATPVATDTPTNATGAAPSSSTLPLALHLASSCTPCGQYSGTNPSQSQIRGALDAAANLYGLPRNLVYGFAWQESRWHQDVQACDGGVGLMQIQYYYADYFNHSSVLNGSGCGLSDTSYDIYTLSGNAYLGAKVIKYLSCYYMRIAAGKYQTAGFGFPDTASTPSLCAQLYNDNTNGPTSTLYQDLPSSVASGWSCPLDPTQGLASAEVLDYTASAYNAGQTAIYNCSCIPNLGYVGAVEYWTSQFQRGALP